MNVLQIKIHEDGTLECSPDFKIIRGSYRNILMNVEVPHSLLLDPVMDESNNVTGNNVRVGAIIRTTTGKNLQTQKYEFERVKDYERDGVLYRLYQRIMPKEFTMWETINQLENATSGKLELVFNIVNWTMDNNASQIEEIISTPTLLLDVYSSTFLDSDDTVKSPSDYDILHSQVQELSFDIDEAETEIEKLKLVNTEQDKSVENLQKNLENKIEALQNKNLEQDNMVDNLESNIDIEINNLKSKLQKTNENLDKVDNFAGNIDRNVENIKNELGLNDNSIGEYLTDRIVSGKNIKVKHNSTSLEVCVDSITAKDIAVKPIFGVIADNVQDAMEIIASKGGSGGPIVEKENEILLFTGPVKEEDAYCVSSMNNEDTFFMTSTYLPFKTELQRNDTIKIYYSYKNHMGEIENEVLDYKVIAVEKYKVTKEMAEEMGKEIDEEFVTEKYYLAVCDIMDIAPAPNTSRSIYLQSSPLGSTSMPKLILGGQVTITFNYDKLAKLDDNCIYHEAIYGNGLHVNMHSGSTSVSDNMWWNYSDKKKTQLVRVLFTDYCNGHSGSLGYNFSPMEFPYYDSSGDNIDYGFHEPVVFNKITRIKFGD